jgi:hypothetical protein
MVLRNYLNSELCSFAARNEPDVWVEVHIVIAFDVGGRRATEIPIVRGVDR